MNWDLVVSFYQIDCGEVFPARKLMCEVCNVPNRILIGDSHSIRIVTTGPPAVFFFWDKEEGRSPRDIGTLGDDTAKHFLKLRFSDP